MTIVHYVIVACLAALLTYLYQTRLAWLKEQIELINDHIKSISNIETLAVEYWLSDGKPSFTEEVLDAARLRGNLAVTSSFDAHAKKMCRARYPRYLELDGRLFDHATGGMFEQVARKADPARAIDIMHSCHEIRAFLREERPRRFWAN